jgi:hypothetical protein
MYRYIYTHTNYSCSWLLTLATIAAAHLNRHLEVLSLEVVGHVPKAAEAVLFLGLLEPKGLLGLAALL